MSGRRHPVNATTLIRRFFGAVPLAGALSMPAAAQDAVRLTTADGVTVFADHHPGEAGLILLFHQGGANGRAEYAAIVPRLVEHGFGALMVDLAGILAFSPASGEPMAACDSSDYIDEVTAPMIALRPANEMAIQRATEQLERFRAAGAMTHVATPGTHGSSMLVRERVDGDVEAAWAAVLAFLRGGDAAGSPDMRLRGDLVRGNAAPGTPPTRCRLQSVRRTG